MINNEDPSKRDKENVCTKPSKPTMNRSLWSGTGNFTLSCIGYPLTPNEQIHA